jgi:hypothetical protein
MLGVASVSYGFARIADGFEWIGNHIMGGSFIEK